MKFYQVNDNGEVSKVTVLDTLKEFLWGKFLGASTHLKQTRKQERETLLSSMHDLEAHHKKTSSKKITKTTS